MNKKRLARVIIAAVVTVAILVAIIVGCGPKWGDGSANANASNASPSLLYNDLGLPASPFIAVVE